MYDGCHKYDSHYKALTHYINCMDDIFIYIVDDWNWKQVREGTFYAIRDLKLQILYEKQIRLTNDDSHTVGPLVQFTWWNGIYISILQKNKY